MGVTVAFVLILAALASAFPKDNTIGRKEREAHVEPANSSPQNSSHLATEQYPALIQAIAKSLETGPINVKTLEDDAEEAQSNRRKRHPTFKKGGKHYGGHGGGQQGNGCGCGGGGGGGGGGGSFSSATASAGSYSYGKK